MKENKIFVFGSNLAGRHGAGSALHAKKYFGAKYGVGKGRTGNAYAIPTKDENLRAMPLNEIFLHVKIFIDYAENNPDLTFEVVKIGCGLAGYAESSIKPMFAGCPDNCILPDGWRQDALQDFGKAETIGELIKILQTIDENSTWYGWDGVSGVSGSCIVIASGSGINFREIGYIDNGDN